jgi:hypothetical protein
MRNWRGCATVTVADACVVDTGVFLRWFMDQDGFERARALQQRLIDTSATAETVDFASVEVAEALRKKGFWPVGSRWRSSPRRSASSTTSE